MKPDKPEKNPVPPDGGELQASTLGDDEKIDPRNEEAIARWARKLGVPQEEFRVAADHAGPCIRDIKQHLVGGFTLGPSS
jgi:hypothetical protein